MLSEGSETSVGVLICVGFFLIVLCNQFRGESRRSITNVDVSSCGLRGLDEQNLIMHWPPSHNNLQLENRGWGK